MAFDSKLTKFTAKTTTGSQIIDTGLGTTADAMIFYFGTLGTTENDVFDDMRFGIGFATADLEQLANGFSWPWNADQVKGSAVDLHGDGVIKIPGAPDGSGNYNETIIAHAELVDVNSDGTIELDWHVVTGVAFPITVYAMSGVANAEIGTYLAPNGNTTTNVGFRPSTIFLVFDGHNYSANFWQYGFGIATDLTHIPAYNDDSLYSRNVGGNFAAWEAFSGVPAADGTYARGVFSGDDPGNDAGQMCIATIAPSGFPITPEYDTWKVHINSNGWATQKDANWVSTVVFVGYLAIDTVYAENFNMGGNMWSDGGTSHILSRVAANAAVKNRISRQVEIRGDVSFGIIDKDSTQSSFWAGLVDNPGNQFSASQAGSGSFNDRVYTRWQARLEGETDPTELFSRYAEIDYFSPTKSDLKFIGTSTPVVVLGELALPEIITLEPEVFCPSEGNPLYVRIKALANANQLQSEVYWEWGPTTSYGFTSDSCIMNYDMDNTTNYSRSVNDHLVMIHVGSPVGDVPLVQDYLGFPYQVIFGSDEEQEFDWEQGTYHVRAVISNYNGITYGNDVEFTINCGGIVDLSKIRLRAFRDGDA